LSYADDQLAVSRLTAIDSVGILLIGFVSSKTKALIPFTHCFLPGAAHGIRIGHPHHQPDSPRVHCRRQSTCESPSLIPGTPPVDYCTWSVHRTSGSFSIARSLEAIGSNFRTFSYPEGWLSRTRRKKNRI